MLWTWPRRAGLALGCLIALVGVITAPAVAGQPDVTLDGSLKGMSSAAAERFLEQHPGAAIDAANADPEATAQWWTAQSPADQKDVIDLIPGTIGNLDGVDYASRDVANRKHLAASIDAARHALARNKNDATQKQVLASLNAIKSTLHSTDTPRRYLISLTDDRPPLAAVSVGNLDTAEQVTFNVPGMGTYTSDMHAWTQSAQNVYDAQGAVGAPKKRAVVAWIGYQTPPPGIDAAFGDYAARGAPRLVADIEGFDAVRNGSLHPALSIVAHSYGTTTSADALVGKGLGIYAFVMLGSAGIETRIADAGELDVLHVYAGEATQDQEARLGRTSRNDPRSTSFGAQVIGVDGDARLNLLPVTGHDPVIHSAWNDDPFSGAWSSITNDKEFADRYIKHLLTFGYLDPGTESIRNVAIATTPNATATITHGH